MNQKSQITLYSGIIVVAFISIIVGYGYFSESKTSAPTDTVNPAPIVSTTTNTPSSTLTTPPNSITTTSTSSPAKTAQNKYKDGTYTAKTSYRTPDSTNEPLEFSVTINGDIVSSIDISDNSNDSTSQYYKQLFQDGITGIIVGQSVDTNSPSRVSGSSLTPKAFNDAMSQIRIEAQL